MAKKIRVPPSLGETDALLIRTKINQMTVAECRNYIPTVASLAVGQVKDTRAYVTYMYTLELLRAKVKPKPKKR